MRGYEKTPAEGRAKGQSARPIPPFFTLPLIFKFFASAIAPSPNSFLRLVERALAKLEEVAVGANVAAISRLSLKRIFALTRGRGGNLIVVNARQFPFIEFIGPRQAQKIVKQVAERARGGSVSNRLENPGLNLFAGICKTPSL